MLVLYDLFVFAAVAAVLLVLYGRSDRLSSEGILYQVLHQAVVH